MKELLNNLVANIHSLLQEFPAKLLLLMGLFFANTKLAGELIQYVSDPYVGQLIGSGLIFLTTAILGATLSEGRYAPHYLYVSKAPRFSLILLTVIGVILLQPIINTIAWANEAIALPSFLGGIELRMKLYEESMRLQTEQLLQANDVGALLRNLLLFGGWAALCEEFFFRGFLFRIAQQGINNRGWTICVTALLFSVAHFQFYGLIPRILMGVLLGWLLIKSQSIWLPIIAHAINNMIVVIVAWSDGRYGTRFEEWGRGDSLYISAIAMTILLLIIRIYKSKSYELRSKSNSTNSRSGSFLE